MAVGMLMVCLLPQAAVAQQEWQSTSTMQGSGSAYSSQVTSVGATGVGSMATTTYSPAAAASGPRRSKQPNTELLGDPGSPIGDALIPLLLCACMYLSVRVFLKRKRALKGE